MQASLADAYDAGLRGDFAPMATIAGALTGRSDAEARAWLDASRGLGWFGAPTRTEGSPVDVRALGALRGQPAPALDLAARALAHAARAAAISFDRARVDRARQAMEQLLSGAGPDAAEARAWSAIVDGWSCVLQGTPVDATLESAGRDGTRLGRADLVIEAIAVRALLPTASVADAVAASRRASRMSRTEALPQSEYLANLALARNRRLDGKPHLATRILRALLAVAPAAWRAWLDWELTLSTGAASQLAREAQTGPAPRLDAMLEAARSGDPARYDRAHDEVSGLVASAEPLRADLAAVHAVVDPRVSLEQAPTDLVAWIRGEGTEPPRGLLGLVLDESLAPVPVCVLSPAMGASRRLLGPGAPLARALHQPIEPAGAEGTQLRTDSTIAALALARPYAVAEELLFRVLYGFAYEPARHQAVRDTLYARARKRIAPAKLERDGQKIWLTHEGALLVPDPRCAPPAEMKILLVLAERAGAAAKDVATELGIPLRTAQDALARLAEDGAVRKERAKLRLTYVLADTTFSEPPAVARPAYGRQRRPARRLSVGRRAE